MTDTERDIVRRLVMVADYRDEISGSHVERVAQYCRILASGIGLPLGDVELIGDASPLHDVGKIGIPDSILCKPGKLSPDEWNFMQQHTTIGARILDGSQSDVLKAGAVIALSHHERWDGTGYPNQLSGENIPIYGRICALADTFDALTSERPQRKALPNDMALQIMEEGRGEHFDPNLFDLFVRNWDAILGVQKMYWNRPHQIPYSRWFSPSETFHQAGR